MKKSMTLIMIFVCLIQIVFVIINIDTLLVEAVIPFKPAGEAVIPFKPAFNFFCETFFGVSDFSEKDRYNLSRMLLGISKEQSY